MKLKCGIDVKTAGVDDHIPENVKPSKFTRKLFVAGVILVGGILIAGVAIATYHLGTQSCNDSYKDTWMTFRRPSDNSLVRERIIRHGDEVEWIRPGLAEVIIDYDKNLLVLQYDEQLRGDDSPICYVYEFPPGMFGSKDDFEMEQQSGVVDVRKEVRLAFKRTNETLSMEMLSSKARDVCFGGRLLKMNLQNQDNDGRRKRADNCIELIYLFIRGGDFEVCF